MSKSITITQEDIIYGVKMFCQIPELIVKIIDRKIIEQTGKEIGIKIETEELQKAADEFRLMHKLQTVEETWNWLDRHSLSMDDFENLIWNKLLNDKLTDHLFADKIEPYFFQNQLDYTEVAMYEVVLEDPDLALELFYSIQEGEISFYEVAHQYIKDTELRRKCGYLGIVNRKQLKPEISAAVFTANPPEVLKPIITAQGVSLILVEDIVKPELDLSLRKKIASDLFIEWLKKQRIQIEVIKNLEVGKTTMK